MDYNNKKFSIYIASPGLENTEKYGTKKYSFNINNKLEKIYKEFIKLHNQKKIKYNNSIQIKGTTRIWKVETSNIKLTKIY